MTSSPSNQLSAPPPPTNRFERHPKKTIFFLLLLVFFLGLFLTEKLLHPAFKPSGSGSRRYINLREHKPHFADSIYPTDDDLRHAEDLERKKYLLRVDPNGYIIPSQVHPEADVTIVFLGGSTTECLYMAETDRFPYLVGRLLEQDSTLQVNSCNSGKAGNNSLHSLDILLNKVMFLHPHIVVMMHNINDLIILLFEQSYWNNNKYKSPLVEVTPSLGQNVAQSLLILRDALIPNVSRALAGLYDRFVVTARPTEFPAVQGKTVKIEPSRLLRDFRANLEIFIDICRRRHIIPVLMTQANRFTDAPDTFIASMMRRLEIQHGITYKDFKTIFDLFNQEIRAAGQASQVLVIDLARQIPPEKAYLYDTVHLTARGSRLASEIISQNLQSVVRNLRTKKNTSTQPD